MSELSTMYRLALNDGLEAMRKWVAETNHELPDDVWKLPKDCPLWRMGLSMAQADCILSAVRNEKAFSPSLDCVTPSPPPLSPP